MKKVILGICSTVVGLYLLFTKLFDTLEDFGLIVRVTDEYFANPQNITNVVEITTRTLPPIIYGMIVSGIAVALTVAIVGAIIGFLKCFS